MLNGYEHEDMPPDDPVFLSNLDHDIGERTNLATVHPELTAELTTMAERWRAGIEVGWTDAERKAGRLDDR